MVVCRLLGDGFRRDHKVGNLCNSLILLNLRRSINLGSVDVLNANVCIHPIRCDSHNLLVNEVLRLCPRGGVLHRYTLNVPVHIAVIAIRR